MNVFNSMSRKLEKFIPREKNNVTMYVCGITPYDTTHLGHAFTYVFFDAVLRYLEYKNYKVFYTQNVTDIDDDILRRAREEKRDWRKLGSFWTEKFLRDMASLNVRMPTHYVKATDSIASMIRIIEALCERGVGYETGGNVYFDIAKDKEYGKLSRFSPEQMLRIAKERGANTSDPNKKHPLDFILWQKSQQHEPFWESPWGKGRPGWHIECSAMVKDYLGNRIDIHGGGRDLVYPHHESEIAQSENATGKKPFVKYWMHTAMVMYMGEKMSKSLGNLVMVSDLLKKYSPNAVRWVLLSHHYRKPWEFEEKELDRAESVTRAFTKHKTKAELSNPRFEKWIRDIIEDDFNFPELLSFLAKDDIIPTGIPAFILKKLGFIF